MDHLVAPMCRRILPGQPPEGAGQGLVAVTDAEKRPPVGSKEIEQAGLDLSPADHLARSGDDQAVVIPAGKRPEVELRENFKLQAQVSRPGLNPFPVGIDLLRRVFPVTVDQQQPGRHRPVLASGPPVGPVRGLKQSRIACFLAPALRRIAEEAEGRLPIAVHDHPQLPAVGRLRHVDHPKHRGQVRVFRQVAGQDIR